MRVISGTFKGRVLSSPKGEVRPTTDLVKGSLFSVLESGGLIEDADCLDLFCGTGALGIEALSRGASSCVFIDENTDNVKSNTDKLGINEKIIRMDFRRALRLIRGTRFDIIFCDPPYKSGYAELAYELIIKYNMLRDDGLLIIEHDSSIDLKGIPTELIADRREFGSSAIEFIRRGNDESIISG